jgi:hypothetical protein
MTAPLPPGQPGTSTLISGDRDAVLVDALLTTSEGERLAAWVQNTGKRPRAFFVTQVTATTSSGPGQCWTPSPGARLLACDQQVVDEARGQTSPEGLAIWNSWFTGQFPPSPRAARGQTVAKSSAT